MSVIKDGDWVIHKKYNVLGFVEKDDEDYFYMKHEEIVLANHIGLRVHKDEIKHSNTRIESKDLELLIDMALETGDKDWFMELTSPVK
jgi:hypothetical protein